MEIPLIRRNRVFFIGFLVLITLALNLGFHVYHVKLLPESYKQPENEGERCHNWAAFSAYGSVILGLIVGVFGFLLVCFSGLDFLPRWLGSVFYFSGDLFMTLGVAVFLGLSIFSLELFTYYLLLPAFSQIMGDPLNAIQSGGFVGFIGFITIFFVFLCITLRFSRLPDQILGRDSGNQKTE